MRRENLEAIFGLSAGQELVLFHCLRETDADDLGFLHVEVEVSGRIDKARFEMAWNAAVGRHAQLRTSFHWEGLSRPVQVVHREAALSFEYVDLQPQESALGTLSRVLAEDRRRGFDLSMAPLSRVTVARIEDETHIVVWAMHHLVADGWSSSLVLDEVFSLYNGREVEQTPSDQLIQYQQFVEWLQTRDQTADMAFWRREMSASAPPTRRFFGSYGRSSGASGLCVPVKRSLSRSESETVLRVAREVGVSMATVMQASCALAFSKVLATNDVVYGLALAGRPHQLRGIESTVGLFATTVPLRVDVRRDMPADEWLREISRKHSQILTHQHITPIQLQSVCEVSLNELFETVLVVQNYPSNLKLTTANDDLTVTKTRGGIASTYPLTIVVQPGDEITILLNCQTRYTEVAEALGDTFLDVVLSLASNSNQPLYQLLAAISSLADRGIAAPTNSHDRRHAVDRPAVTTGGDVRLTDLQEKLTTIWCDVLGYDDVGLDDNLVDLGVDSIRSLQIIARIRDAGYSISPVALLAHPTIRALAIDLDPEMHGSETLVGASDTGRGFQPLVLLKPDGENAPLFCLHTPGGDPIHFADLARVFEADRPIYGVKSRAADGRQPFESIGEMASEYVVEMLRLLPEGPFHLFSSCGGGTVTLETARQLHDAGANIGAVIILDPGWVHPEKSDWFLPEERLPLYRRLATHARSGQLFAKVVNFARIRYRQASGRRKARRFRDDLDEVHRLAFDSYWSAGERYKPPQYPRRLTMILTDEWTKQRLDWPARMARWSRIAVGGIDVRSLPGWHEEALRRPRVSETCSVLESVMSETESSARLDESPRPQNPESLFRS